MTNIFEGIPRAPFHLLGYDLSKPDELLRQRGKRYFDRYLWDIYPIALACAERLDPTFQPKRDVDQLLDPTFEALARSLEELLADYLASEGVCTTVSIIITPLRGELAYGEPLGNSSYRIVINEYLLLTLDSLVRYIINCTENARPNPADPVSDQQTAESREGDRLALAYQPERFEAAFDILNADLFVRYVTTLFTGLAPGVCDNPETLDDLLEEWVPSMNEEAPFGYQESYEEYYVECYLMILACLIGHETAHLTEGHFKNEIHEAQHQLMGQRLNTPLMSLYEMQADVKASDFAFHVRRSLDLKDVSSRLTGHVMAFCLPSLLEGISHQLRHGSYDDDQACLIASTFNAQLLDCDPGLWNTHMPHMERCGLAYAHAVSCLDENTYYQNEDYMLSLQAAMFWICCMGGTGVEDSLEDMAIPPHRHPLLLQTSLQKRLESLDKHHPKDKTSFVHNGSLLDLIERQGALWKKFQKETGLPEKDQKTFSHVFSTLRSFAATLDKDQEHDKHR